MNYLLIGAADEMLFVLYTNSNNDYGTWLLILQADPIQELQGRAQEDSCGDGFGWQRN